MKAHAFDEPKAEFEAKWKWKEEHPVLAFIKDIPWKFRRIPANLNNCRYSIKWFFQRGKNGFADVDWFNMNAYLCDIIPKMLRTLAEESHGYPADMTHEEYQNKLISIADVFDEYVKYDSNYFWDEETKSFDVAKQKELLNEMKGLFDILPALWD